MNSLETTLYTSVLLVCFIVAGVIFYFVHTLLRQYKLNQVLRRENSLVQISSIERERSRIAKDLHDDVCVSLNLAKQKLWRLQLKNEEELEKKQAVGTTLDELLIRIKEISFDLMPGTLQRMGLAGGIRQLIDSVTDSYNVDINFTSTDLKLSRDDAINIFRVVQECLHNSLKHSKATSITISYWVEMRNLVLIFADNGIGLDYDEQLKHSNGFGLRNICDRIEIMGGELFVESKKGHGLSYVFEIPMKT